MPLYFRDTISFGPFRINLSKSGVGISAGVTGFRIGSGPRGHYIHAGANGYYYRQTLGGIGKKGEKEKSEKPLERAPAKHSDQSPATYLTQDGVVMKRVMSRGAEELQGGSRADAISSLNEARQRTGFTWPVGLLGVLVTVLIAVSSSPPVATLTAGVTTLALLVVAQRADVSRRNVVFAYQLDQQTKSTYENLLETLDRLGRSDGLWYIDASGDVENLIAWKRNAGASQLVSKHNTALSYDQPPGVQSNISPPSIRVENKYLYFMPDCILVREGNIYGAVSYGDLRLATRPSRFIVEDTVPQDCEIVGQTWKHPNKKGGPDRRFANNRELPICLFEELGIISSSGIKALIMASSREAIMATETALKKIAQNAKEAKAPDHVLLTYDG